MILRFLFVLTCVAAATVGPIPADAQEKPTQHEHEEIESQQWENAKSPENWTIEERLSVRFDSVQNEKRRIERLETAKIPHGSERNPGWSDSPLDRIEINGDSNPELILRWELFDDLIRSAFVGDSSDATVFRRIVSSRTEWITGRENFWAILEDLSAEFIENVEQYAALGNELQMVGPEEAARIQVKIQSVALSTCRSRAEALAQARNSFGKWQFDRFLYEGVAPGLSITEFVEVDIDHLIRKKRAVAGGCQ